MDYLNRYRKMIALRGLTHHTMVSYCIYINSYLDYIKNALRKYPSQVTCGDIRLFPDQLQKNRGLSDRTVNAAISQLRFFTMYVLHKPWDATQVPMRRFDAYMPYVPSQGFTLEFISTISDLKLKTMVFLWPPHRVAFPPETGS